MKILEAEWENHPILGNLTLDFRQNDGLHSNIIIFAGENGSGKTAILESLFDACNFAEAKHLKKLKVFDEVHNRIVTLTPDYLRQPHQEELFRGLNITLPDGRIIDTGYASNFRPNLIGSNDADPRNSGCAYSSAQSIYEVKQVENISSKDVDSESLGKSRKIVSPQYIKELLIAIDAQDSLEYKRLGQQNPVQSNDYATFEPNSRVYRFKNAFNTFFDTGIEYEGIEKVGNQHEVFFKKNNQKIPLNALSTGESQIVFRGGQLLSNVKKINNGVIFIDEPEISMHPKWQGKILKYYKDIFSTGGTQTAQLILATHSEGVVAEGKEEAGTKIIVLTRDPNGQVIEGGNKKGVLPTLIAAEVNYLAFDVLSTDYHIALYATVQNISGKTSIKQVDQWIAQTPQYLANPLPKPDSVTLTKTRRDGTTRSFVQNYDTLPTYIRNQIDHPNPIPNFTQDQMKQSIDLLRCIIENHP